jgi:hypothetical protein
VDAVSDRYRPLFESVNLTDRRGPMVRQASADPFAWRAALLWDGLFN